MGDSRTKLDILYQDVLGEINDVITRMDELQKRIQSGIDNTSNLLTDKAVQMLKASEQITAAVSQVNLMARGIVIFAADEQAKIQATQEASQKETVDMFMRLLKKNTDSFKAQLWIIFTVLSANTLASLVALFLLRGR